jgi:hypothetical protein
MPAFNFTPPHRASVRGAAALLLAGLTLVTWVGCEGTPDERGTATAAKDADETNLDRGDGAARSSEAEAATHADTGAGDDRPAGLETLVGSWRRTDGDYTLQVVKIDKNGDTQAAYYNPRPIHVAKAKAEQNEDRLKLFVELRDTFYPGCIYELDYDPPKDILSGIYFQAAEQQKYPVTFVRAQ